MLGIHLQGLRSSFPAIENGGNRAGNAKAPGRIFAPGFAGRCFYDDLIHKSFPISKANFV
jgi:hypothetical protein